MDEHETAPLTSAPVTTPNGPVSDGAVDLDASVSTSENGSAGGADTANGTGTVPNEAQPDPNPQAIAAHGGHQARYTEQQKDEPMFLIQLS